MVKKEYFMYAIYFSLFLLSIVLLLLPVDFFDSGQSICLSVLLFDKQCYGCGMTRAVQHLIHLDFKGAYHFNKISFIVLPLFVFLVLSELRKLLERSKTNIYKDKE